MAYFLSNEAVCCSGTRVHCFAASNLGRFEPIGCNRRACGVCSRVEWSLRGSVAPAAEWLLLALGRVRLGQRPGLSTRGSIVKASHLDALFSCLATAAV